MSDYIKREDALDVIEITPFEDYGDYIKAREIIENLPTIEAVPKDFHDKTCEAMAKRHTEEIQKLMPSIDIVRCQDCKHWVYNFNGCARNPCTEPWYATDFCNYGEREGE